MKIEELELSKISENSYNPNAMADDLFESLVASIRDHGYVQPIIVRPAGGAYEIVDGAHRFRALKELGRKLAQCVVVRDDEEAAKLRTLTMNRLRGRADNFDVAKMVGGLKPESAERYLAYNRKQQEELKALLKRVPAPPLSKLRVEPVSVVVEFLMTRNDAAEVRRAISAVNEESRSKALLAICRFYLERAGKDTA